ncbi:hypothetical protein RSOLAG1IB_11788 [Rhizoctonia solani AG-1 IB]|uniref:Uncharacterized protein n=1 Tax=Thanatephorus cucumeris (strain AG1-IB / isolate 7/3/14) TaxID=1108050 RepID=A0A0B7FF58_THACB|nr:hypothetical protein RSOLAG1IB_11788 [Rhizoctonia solani AG-1 IB]
MIQTNARHQTTFHPPTPPPSLPHGMWFRSHPTEIKLTNQSTHSAGKGSQPSEANVLSPSRYTGDGRCGDPVTGHRTRRAKTKGLPRNTQLPLIPRPTVGQLDVKSWDSFVRHDRTQSLRGRLMQPE